jgi:hypothetical protein
MTLSKCDNEGEVSGEAYAGGIAGRAEAPADILIDESENKGAVYGGTSGGVIGAADAGVKISRCANYAAVSGGQSGGIAGTNSGLISRSRNLGETRAEEEGGGIAGMNVNQTEAYAIITACYNDGKTSGAAAGGITGVNRARVINCYNTGAAETSGGNSGVAGGVAGDNTGEIICVYSAGATSGGGVTGGVVGRNRGRCDTAFWLGNIGVEGVGTRVTGDSFIRSTRLTDKELSGQELITLTGGYELLVKIMNDNDPEANGGAWVYSYFTLSTEPARIAGNGVKRGNVISNGDLENAYIYPQLRELIRQ